MSTSVRATLLAAIALVAVVATVRGFWDDVFSETIVGVIVGFGLAEVTRHLRDRGERFERTTAVRTMLAIEIDCNLRALDDAWARVIDVAFDADDPPRWRARVLARRLAEVPFPRFMRPMWEGRPEVVAGALPGEELVAVDRLYARLDSIAGIRETLLRIAEHDAAEARAAPVQKEPVYGHAYRAATLPDFDVKAEPLWQRVTAIIEAIRATGNPLRPGSVAPDPNERDRAASLNDAADDERTDQDVGRVVQATDTPHE